MLNIVDNIIRSKRRTIGLEVAVNGQVIVRAPKRASLQDIYDFVNKQHRWILRKKHLMANLPRAIPKQFQAGETFLFLGTPYTLTIMKNAAKPLYFTQSFQLAETHITKANTLFVRWYKQQALTIITERVNFFAQQYGYQYKNIKITSAKTRWGSCNNKGTLSFTWRLIMAPLPIIDYVVVHELAHLKQMNHSAKFWNLVQNMLPDYKISRNWLHTHAHTLTL